MTRLEDLFFFFPGVSSGIKFGYISLWNELYRGNTSHIFFQIVIWIIVEYTISQKSNDSVEVLEYGAVMYHFYIDFWQHL